MRFDALQCCLPHGADDKLIGMLRLCFNGRLNDLGVEESHEILMTVVGDEKLTDASGNSRS